MYHQSKKTVAREPLFWAISCNDKMKRSMSNSSLFLEKIGHVFRHVPHVSKMILLHVVLLSLLQSSSTKTVKAVLPHYTLKIRRDCHFSAAEKKRLRLLLVLQLR